MKKISISVLASFVFTLIPVFASAHVVVTPKSVPGNSYQTFVMSVPVEKPTATTRVRLLIPEGVTSVRPNVKPGWNIEVKKQIVGTSTEVVSEIIWTGTIPADFRDEFAFSVKTPKEGILNWKAYQTYSDGTIVAWDADPKVSSGAMTTDTKAGPYSSTVLTAAQADAHAAHGADASSSVHASHDLILPLLALALACLALYEIIDMKKKIDSKA